MSQIPPSKGFWDQIGPQGLHRTGAATNDHDAWRAQGKAAIAAMDKMGVLSWDTLQMLFGPPRPTVIIASSHRRVVFNPDAPHPVLDEHLGGSA